MNNFIPRLVRDIMANIPPNVHVDPAHIRQGIERHFAETLAVTWSTEDVISEAAEMMGVTVSTEEAVRVLEFVYDAHDPQEGITWSSLRSAVERVMELPNN